jgi:putative ABC transport system ATP-binding protein
MKSSQFSTDASIAEIAINSSPVLRVENLSKSYKSGDHMLTVLSHVTFSLQEAASCAIVGPSGSGKTTLLGLCAGLDRPSTGAVSINGIALDPLNEDERAKVRNALVGFVFQNFQLMPTLTALENVMVPLELRGESGAKAKAMEMLQRVGLEKRMHHYPAQLSGKEQQRVALARAFINRPKILFADEPTGNLDAETSEKIVHLLFDLNREARTTLVLVTHNPELAQRTQRIMRLKGGVVISDESTDHKYIEKAFAEVIKQNF